MLFGTLMGTHPFVESVFTIAASPADANYGGAFPTMTSDFEIFGGEADVFRRFGRTHIFDERVIQDCTSLWCGTPRT